jgi:hypothetical protein
MNNKTMQLVNMINPPITPPSRIINKIQMINYIRQFILQIAVNRFKWQFSTQFLNLTSLELEKFIYQNATLAFVKLNGNYYITRYSSTQIDGYGREKIIQPIQFVNSSIVFPEYMVYNGGEKFGDEYAIIINENNFNVSTETFILNSIEEIVDIFNQKKINRITSTKKVIFKTNKNNRESTEKSLNELFSDSSFYTIVNEDSVIDVESVDTNVQYQQQDYWQDINSAINFAMDFLGLENAGVFQKKVQALQAEQRGSTVTSNLILNQYYNNRLDFIDKIKKIHNIDLGLTINVEKTDNNQTQDKEVTTSDNQ